MEITIPELSLVLLIGATSSGKSTFARRHFGAAEVISAGGELSVVEERLARGELVVVDGAHLQAEERSGPLRLAKRSYVRAVAIVLALPENVIVERQMRNGVRRVGKAQLAEEGQAVRRLIPRLAKEGFSQVEVFTSEAAVEAARVSREPLRCRRVEERGPFDIIGDVHGCFDELVELLERLGYALRDGTAMPPAGRKAVFVGDLVDRGPKIARVLELVMAMVAAGHALCVPGNHDDKLMRKLRGGKVQVAHGLEQSLAQLAAEPEAFSRAVEDFLERWPSHYVLDGGRLVVAHAGLRLSMHGRETAAVRDFALYGATTGDVDESGLPVRGNWATDYTGGAMVLYGHTPVARPEWENRTLNIDTGCVFGGRLTALRYPELELVSVPACAAYAESRRPFTKSKQEL